MRKNLEIQNTGPKEFAIEAKALLTIFLIKQGRDSEAAPLEQDLLSYYASTCEPDSQLREMRNWEQLTSTILEISDAYLQQNQQSLAKKFADRIYSEQKKMCRVKKPSPGPHLGAAWSHLRRRNNQTKRGRVLREALE